MDRRGFFKLFGAGIAGIALEQAIPLGRVWSFPTNIVVPEFTPFPYIGALALEKIRCSVPTLYEQEVVMLNLIEKHAQPGLVRPIGFRMPIEYSRIA